jgi:hypothetical protein
MEFRGFLDNAVGQLRLDARNSGVHLPPNYWFSFAAQKGMMTFSPRTVAPLAAQLSDIRALCGTIIDAKINALAWVKRAPVDSLDSAGGQDYLEGRPTTNEFTIVMPYEVAFHGFSAELAAVLEGLVRLPQCFVVTHLVVEPLEAPLADRILPVPRPRLLGPAHDGLRIDQFQPLRLSRPAFVQPAPSTVLNERPLRFVLSVQSVRLRPDKGPGLAAAQAE